MNSKPKKEKPKPKKEKPMGVSQWKEHGKKFGYWKYFKKNTEEIIPKDKIKNLAKHINQLKKSEDFGVFLIYKPKKDESIHARMFTGGRIKRELDLFKSGFNFHYEMHKYLEEE